MQFNHSVNRTRSLAAPFIPAPQRTPAAGLTAPRLISSLGVRPRRQTGTREWRIYRTRRDELWEDWAFGVLELTSIAGTVLALRVVLFS